MPDYVLRRVAQNHNTRDLPVKGSRILLLGLAYKRNTGDARESPSRRLAELLLGWGAEVMIAYPHTSDEYVPECARRVDATPVVFATAVLVVLLVELDDFARDRIVRRPR